MPRKIRDMSKSIYTANVDKRTVVDKTLNRTAYNLLRLNSREHSLFLFCSVTLEKFPT